jgi:ABC-type transport system involved in multi-copper enzyme maturation permease subunit
VSRLLAAEWVKVTTVRTFIWVALADIGFVLVVSIATIASSGDIHTAQDARGAAQIASLALILGLIAGILMTAGESTHGTITQTLLVAPVRERVLLVKAVVGAALSLGLVVVAVALVLLVLVPGASLEIQDARLVLLGTIIAAPIVGGLGVGLGTILRGQGAAITVSLLWLLIGENFLPVISKVVAPYSPGRAVAALVSGDRNGNADAYLLGVANGGLVALVWAVVALTVGAVVLSRRDI